MGSPPGHRAQVLAGSQRLAVGVVAMGVWGQSGQAEPGIPAFNALIPHCQDVIPRPATPPCRGFPKAARRGTRGSHVHLEDALGEAGRQTSRPTHLAERGLAALPLLGASRLH